MFSCCSSKQQSFLLDIWRMAALCLFNGFDKGMWNVGAPVVGILFTHRFSYTCWHIVSPSPVTSTKKTCLYVRVRQNWQARLIPQEPTIWPGVISDLHCYFHTLTPAMSLCHCVCVPKKYVWVCHCVIQYHTERIVPTRLKKRCPEVGCPFPTGSPFQWLEIPLCTKRPDMIPQHCRRGRELGTVLIRLVLLSGKILKGMQPIVVNCMGLHSIPCAAGMYYLFWIGGTSILTGDQCLCFVLVNLFGFVDCALFFYQSGLLTCNNITCSQCSEVTCFTHTFTHKCAFEGNMLIPFNTHLENPPLYCPVQ